MAEKPPTAGFCALASGLQTPVSPFSPAKLPKVSSQFCEYSRFRETAAGDFVRSRLLPRTAVLRGCAAVGDVTAPELNESGKSSRRYVAADRQRSLSWREHRLSAPDVRKTLALLTFTAQMTKQRKSASERH